MNKIIYFSLEGPDRILRPNSFVVALSRFVQLLDELDAAISREQTGTMLWEIISLRKDSPATVGLLGRLRRPNLPDYSKKIYGDCVDGLRLLSHKAERLPVYSDRALDKTENLAQIRMKNRLADMRVIYEGHEASIEPSTYANIQTIRGESCESSGSVVGKLDAITVHNGYEFRIWSDNTGKPVTCKFDPEKLDQVKDLLRHRVLVYGLVKWNHLGHPISIDVEGIETQEVPSEPTIEEMSGLISDFTEGKSLRDYMEELRNG